jgi:hypothetical protein
MLKTHAPGAIIRLARNFGVGAPFTEELSRLSTDRSASGVVLLEFSRADPVAGHHPCNGSTNEIKIGR